jgi:hypothetical protein
MSDDDNKPERDPKTGRWKPGARSPNPAGRPKGSITVAKSQNLRDSILTAAEQRGREINPDARDGDGVAAYLKWLSETEPRAFSSLLGRILPLLPAKVALPPIEKPSDLVAASAAIAKAVSEGDLAPTEGSAISAIVQGVGRSMEINQLAARLDALEQRLAQK